MKRRNLKLLNHFEKVKEHLNHVCKFYQGHENNFGHIKTVVLDESLEAVKVFIMRTELDLKIIPGKMPELIYSEQIIECSCQRKYGERVE